MCTVQAKNCLQNMTAETFSALLLPLLYEIYIFGFSCCSTREDHSIDVSITNVGLILTKLGWFLFSGYRHSGDGQDSISNFFEKKSNFWVPCCSTREYLFIDVSNTNVGLILTKLWWFQLFGTSQNSISNLFEEKNQILGFLCCSIREDLSIDISITNVGLILTKPGWFLFSGYGQTDTVLESSYGNMSAHKKFQLKTQN